MKQYSFEILRQILVGDFHIDRVVGSETAQQRLIVGDHSFATAPPPRLDCSLFERLLRIGRYQGFIKHHFLAEPMAHRACARWSIEGEMLRCERLVTLAGRRAEVAI